MMMKYVSLFFIAVSIVSSSTIKLEFESLWTNPADVDPPRLNLNLDLSPCDRWKDIARQADPKAIETGIRSLLQAIFPTSQMINMAEAIASKLDRYFQEPYSTEMRCLSEISGISLGDVVLANVFYELTAVANSSSKACTSIVSLDKNKQIIHGRNFDITETEFMKNITVVIDFQRNNKTVFTGVTFMGCIGLTTGVRHGAFSLSGNARFYGSLYDNLLSMLSGGQITSFTTRRVLDESSDYLSALNQLTNTPTAAPIYFILGGRSEGEGAIVVRNGLDVAVVKRLRDYTHHNWFLVETNYDPWVEPPKSDNRRNATIQAMMKIGKDQMDVSNLYKVLSTPPMLNKKTVFSTIMSASNSSYFFTKIRSDKDETNFFL